MSHTGGRPSKYNQQILDKAWEYLDLYDADEGSSCETGFPTIEGLTAHLDVNRSTLYEWRRAHEEFNFIMDKVQNIQTIKLINCGLAGRYKASMVIFLMKRYWSRSRDSFEGF